MTTHYPDRLPSTADSMERIEHAIAMFQKAGYTILQALILNTIAYKHPTLTITKGEDKYALIDEAKKAAKDFGLCVNEDNSKIKSGYLVQIRHNKQCLMIIVSTDPVPESFNQKHGFTFVPLKETSSQPQGKRKKKGKKRKQLMTT